MAKLEFNRLSLKLLLILLVGFITLALLVSCISIGPVAPAEIPPTPPAETPPTPPAETPPTPPKSEELPGKDSFVAPAETSDAERRLLSPGPAFDCFLKIEGIDGESTDSAHERWIDILSYSWGLAQPGSGLRSSGGSRTLERCDHQDFSVTKELDKTSPKLALFCSNGTHIEEVTVELCRETEDRQKFMEYTFTDVIITSVSISGDTLGAEEKPVEEVTFNYGVIKWTYTETDPKTGKALGDVSAYWDVEANKGG